MSNDQAIILDTIDKFLEKEVRPVVKEYELADKYPHEIVSKMKELGLFGSTISELTLVNILNSSETLASYP